MPLKTKNLKFMKLSKKLLFIAIITISISATAQKRVKLDGVATVVGKNIVLDSEIEGYKKQLEQQSEGKAEISTCEMLEQIMDRKLLAHHAVIDSVVVNDAEVNSRVEQKIAYFMQQLGSEEKLYKYYGFDNMSEMRKEFNQVEKEALLIQKMQQKLTEKVDVTPEEVRNYYLSLEKEGNLPDFGAEVELSQIVLKAQPTADEEDRVIKKLNEIRDEIKNGASMTMKAIINSNDPGVTDNKGAYTITRESPLVKEFKEAAFSLDEGEISEPFKSQYGYHILKVEKIKGRQRDTRHILIQPEVTTTELNRVKDSLTNIRKEVLTLKMTFEEAVKKYSDDKVTKSNNGLIVNPQSSDTKFDLTRMDPSLYARISELNQGDITDVFYDETREGEKMFKIILVKKKTAAHKANLTEDYVKIQDLALQKKKQETIEKWAKEKVGDTYIKINNDYKKCKFKNNWAKN